MKRFDTDPLLFNCLNATIDLRTGQPRPHRREDYLTKISPTVFDIDADCPVFNAFLESITLGNKRLAEFIQRAAGYSLTGLTIGQTLFLLIGTGSNGKSTLVDALTHVMGGDYSQQVKTEVLMDSKYYNKDVHIADLQGIRLGAACESEMKRKFATALVKQMTGGDQLVGKRLYESPIRFTPEFKLWFSTNHKPRIDDTTESIWRRLKIIPFNAYFPEGGCDEALRDKLRAEGSGILNWMLRGCRDWQRNGLGTPEEVRGKNEEYRRDEDLLGLFLADRCLQAPDAWESIKALYEGYCDWCKENGEKAETQKTMGTLLTERGFIPDRTRKDGRIRRGLRLKKVTRDAMTQQ